MDDKNALKTKINRYNEPLTKEERRKIVEHWTHKVEKGMRLIRGGCEIATNSGADCKDCPYSWLCNDSVQPTDWDIDEDG